MPLQIAAVDKFTLTIHARILLPRLVSVFTMVYHRAGRRKYTRAFRAPEFDFEMYATDVRG